MSAEENKAIIRRLFEEIFYKGNLAAADEEMGRTPCISNTFRES